MHFGEGGTTQANGMEGQRAGVCPVASPAHDRNALNGAPEAAEQSKSSAEVVDSAQVVASSAHDRNAMNGAPGLSCEAAEQSKSSAEVVGSSAHNNFLPEKSAHDRNALNDAPGSPCEAAGICEQSNSCAEAIASCRNALNGAPGSPCEAAGIREKSKSSADVVASSAHNNFTGAALPLVSKASQTHITRQVPGQRERASPAQHFWLTQDGLRVNFRGNKFTVPVDVELAESCDTSLANTLEFHLKGHSRENPLRLLQRLRSTYSSPSSPLFNQNLQFDVVDERLYVTMPGSISSDFVAELVMQQLENYQLRVAHRFPAQPSYILSGSSALVHIDGAPIRLCGDGCVVEKDELISKTKEVHAIRRAVPRNLKVYVNFEALSYTDAKRALISKCEQQVLTGQAQVAVALCDRVEAAEVYVFSKGDAGELIVDKSVNPRFIDLSKVLPSFRVYLSYGVNIYFQAHHSYELKRLQKQEITSLLCDSILQQDKEMAKELINGLPSINNVDDHGRLAMVCAAGNGDKEMVDYLLDNGAEVNKMDARGVSPLLVARAKGYDDIANLIESRGASIDLSCSALVDAIHKAQLERLELLLQAGAMVDDTDAQGRTPLMHACLFMHKDAGDAVRHLLRAGASPSLHDNFGRSARDLAEIIRNDIALTSLDSSAVHTI